MLRVYLGDLIPKVSARRVDCRRNISVWAH
jgi:hypothetical protein